MCNPLLAAGVTGYGASQIGKKDPKDTVTNNYYNTGPESEKTSEAANQTGNTANKTQRPQGPAQSSKTDRAY